MAKLAFVDVTATVSFGGVQTAVWQLARTLAECGHQVTVIGGEGKIRGAEITKISVQTFTYRTRDQAPNFGSRFRKLAERWSFRRSAKQAVLAQDYDWVILTKPYDFFWASRLPRNCRTRFAFMSGGTDFFWGDQLLAKRIHVWLSCSHFNAWQLASRYGRFPAVIYNGVDTTRFTPLEDAQETRKQLGIAPGVIAFAYAGRLVGWKGLQFVLQAMAHPLLASTKPYFYIVGEGAERAELENLARALGIETRVHFLGALPHSQLPHFYRAVDAGIFPSIADEAFGITIAEAMSCGKPVIASYIGGIPEVVGNEGHCGFLVPPMDIQALATRMAELTSDANLRACMGKAARERIMQNFTWRQSATRLAAAMGLDLH